MSHESVITKYPKVQSVIFPRERFTIAEARTYLLRNNLKANKVDTTNKFYRFRQRRPKKSSNYFTVHQTNGVEMIMMY